MFDANQFYPTPIKIAAKMQSALSSDRHKDSIFPILEPSAGKGDLIPQSMGVFRQLPQSQFLQRRG